MITVGKKRIGDGNPCFITFEAGPTHDGLESAMALVKAAADAGGDAVKFQIFDVDELVADRQMPYSYEVLVDRNTGRTEPVSEPLYDILKRRCMPESDWRKLKAYSDSLGLTFFATVTDQQGLELVRAIGCDSIKIASADINYLPFLREVARCNASIQIDTGNATFGEIEQAIDLLRKAGNDRVIIHNCPSGYPAYLPSINLNMIPALKQLFRCPVAYSDHSPGHEMDIAAVALGANLIEKTITLDRCTRSVEHVMSLEPTDMKGFIQTIRNIETAMGQPRRMLTDEEKKKRLNVRRSVMLAGPARAGQPLRDVAVKFKRPGYGIAPDAYEGMLDMCFAADLPAGHLLSIHDLR